MTEILRVENASKAYGEKEGRAWALRQVSAGIEEKDFVVILGPSGSGKSTLLNLLSGLERADEGAVFFAGDDLSRCNDQQLRRYRRLHTGFIFQEYHLIPNLTVRENIEIGRYLNKEGLEIDELVEELDIGSMEKRFPHELSGGQQQRVAIARALIKKPDILFCDEATGALDEGSGKQVLKIIQRLRRKYGLTVVFVTHNTSISQMANHIIMLNSGKLVKELHSLQPLDVGDIHWS
ncbi:ABC transporter ATP-binding protein [Paenibacillus sp. HW567]|uniref:ABC transporter ATP-binding protein n=1 Tax=Paenibacillus sp. HW567 TaxID=1034769 RepID=UPI00037D0FFB|nr:ABC transporter ATP-binding protein [Paenibacillus sp. HW567]